MSFVTIFLLALSLAMDAFAVSISSGVTIGKMQLRHSLRIAAFFGIFQAVMPLLGWGAGHFAADVIRSFDHWVAFILLSVIGGKMIYESFFLEEHDQKAADPRNIFVLFTLAIATSIDAAPLGVSLSVLSVRIVTPALIIGAITFAVSLAGTFIGQKVGDLFEGKIEIAGGLVLIGIGVKILFSHLLS